MRRGRRPPVPGSASKHLLAPARAVEDRGDRARRERFAPIAILFDWTGPTERSADGSNR